MTSQPWWNNISGHILEHVGDDAYQRHYFRIEVDRNIRSLARTQQATSEDQVAALRQGFERLGVDLPDFHDLAVSLDSIANAIGDLESTISWEFAEVKWRQEQTNLLLQDVLKTLRHPTGIQGEELRERGNEYFGNALDSRRPQDKDRWIDLALKAYQESLDYNATDFSVLHSIGVILFFEKGNSEDALRYFREAAWLAEPYSKHHAAMAWVNSGYIYRNRRQTEDAYYATSEALTVEPYWAESHYQHAVHCAIEGLIEEMEENLLLALEIDPSYYLKAETDPELLPFPSVRNFLIWQLDNVVDEKYRVIGRLNRRVDEAIRKQPRSSHQIFEDREALVDILLKAEGYAGIAEAIRKVERSPFVANSG